MGQPHYLGVDIGTTSTKAVLFKKDGTVVGMHHVEYPLYSPSPAIAEQNPDEILAAVIETIKVAVQKGGIKSTDLALVSFSSAMHSVIAVDEYGKPLTKCITWADSRATKTAEMIKNELNGLAIYMRT